MVTFGLRCGLKLVCWAEGRILEEGNIGDLEASKLGGGLKLPPHEMSCHVRFDFPASHPSSLPHKTNVNLNRYQRSDVEGHKF